MFRLTITLMLSAPGLAYGGIFTGGNGICSANPPTYWHRVERVTGVPWARFVVRWQPALCSGRIGPLVGAVAIPATQRPTTSGTDDLGLVVDSATVGAP